MDQIYSGHLSTKYMSLVTSQLHCFGCLSLSCQLQKNTKNDAAVTSSRTFQRSSAFSKQFSIFKKSARIFFYKILLNQNHNYSVSSEVGNSLFSRPVPRHILYGHLCHYICEINDVWQISFPFQLSNLKWSMLDICIGNL